jgi:hypothetical protein
VAVRGRRVRAARPSHDKDQGGPRSSPVARRAKGPSPEGRGGRFLELEDLEEAERAEDGPLGVVDPADPAVEEAGLERAGVAVGAGEEPGVVRRRRRRLVELPLGGLEVGVLGDDGDLEERGAGGGDSRGCGTVPAVTRA